MIILWDSLRRMLVARDTPRTLAVDITSAAIFFSVTLPFYRVGTHLRFDELDGLR